MCVGLLRRSGEISEGLVSSNPPALTARSPGVFSINLRLLRNRPEAFPRNLGLEQPAHKLQNHLHSSVGRLAILDDFAQPLDVS